MIQLFQYKPVWDLANASPFCMKVETFLKMAKLPYNTTILPDPRKSPKGKLPYIKDGDDTISDSDLIIAYLSKKYNLEFDAQLTDSQKTMALGLQRMIEEHLYWVIVYNRWIDPTGWLALKQAYFSSLPKPLQGLIPAIVRRDVRKALHGHGLGRHTPDEIYQFGIDDLEVIKNQLNNHDFLLDTKQPTSIEATGYAFIANILQAPFTSPIQTFTHKHACFERYCQKIQGLYFTE